MTPPAHAQEMEMAMGEAPLSRRDVDVLVVDDHTTFADAVSLAIQAQDGLRCVATVGNAEDALSSIRAACPDVVLLDVSLPGMAGIEAIREMHRSCRNLRVIVLTGDTAGATLVAAVEAGADAFVTKEQPFADVLEAIRDRDSTPLANVRTIKRLVEHAHAAPAPESGRPMEDLTDREAEILVLLADGLTAKQIAQELDISIHTCRGHVRNLLRKFHSRSQLEVVVKAGRAGMLPNLQLKGR